MDVQTASVKAIFITLKIEVTNNGNEDYILESINNNISSDNSSTSNNDYKDRDYYKTLVDRSKINYSPDFINDNSKDISTIQVFEINDTHGAFHDESGLVGIGRVATCINEKTIDPYGVVKIANGDILQGTAFSNMLIGEPGIAALNEMNFDCFVIGNHEFDWGLDELSIYKDGDESNGELNNHSLGNLILLAEMKIQGSAEKAIESLSKILNLNYKLLLELQGYDIEYIGYRDRRDNYR